MAKISTACLEEAFSALRNFSKKELQQYARDVFVRAKDHDPLQGADAIERAQKEINEEKLKEFFNARIAQVQAGITKLALARIFWILPFPGVN